MQQSETVKKYDSYKDSGIEWIGEIPQEWNVRKIKYLAKISSGDGLTRELLCENGNFPVFGGGSIIGYTNDCNTTLDNILIGRVGANCGCITWLNNNCWATDNALKVKLMTNFHKKLFYYFLISLELNRLNDSNAQPLITSTKILNTFVSYPADIKEQQQIAEYLDKKCGAIDEVIETDKSVIEKLKEYKQSIITEAVTKGLDKSVPLKDSGIEWIGKIPQEWDINRGKNVLSLLKRGVKDDMEVITCFRDGEVTLRSNRREEGFTFADKEIGYQGIEIGDLVIHGMDGFAGAIGISDSYGKGSPVLNVCNPKYNYSAKYFCYYLRMLATQDIFVALATGIRERSCDLRWNKIANLIFIIPNEKEQQQIAEYLDNKCSEIDKALAEKEQVIEKFTEYKKSLIYECVTGKRKVV